jgi:hypothetical protein
MHYGN